jgi:hypothetical protein
VLFISFVSFTAVSAAVVAKREHSHNESERRPAVTALVRQTLFLFGVTMPPETLDRIERMRARVNIMKHGAGLELEHFITQ